MNEKQLRALKYTVEFGTVAQAADIMCVTQPAVSQMLTALENDLGFKVLNRKQGRTTATPHGLHLLNAANTALDAFDAVRNVANTLRNNSMGQIRLSATPGFTLSVLPRVVAEFRKAFPDCKISLQARTSPRTSELISTQVVDFGFIDLPFPPDTPNLRVYRMRCSCMFPTGHPFEALDVVTPDDLAGQDMVALYSWHQTTAKLIELMRAAGHAFSPAIECNLFYSALQTARYTGMAAFGAVDRSLMQMADTDMISRPFEPAIYYEMGVVRSHNPDHQAEKDHFDTILVQELTELMEAAP